MQVGADDIILSDRSDDMDDFIKGLKGMCLFEGRGPDPEPPPQPNKSTKQARPKAKPRRRPPMDRVVVPLDDVVTPPDSEARPPPSGPSAGCPAASLRPVDTPLTRLEHSIENYLAAQFRSVRQEFISEFENFMNDSGRFDAEIDSFLSDLRTSVGSVFAADPSHLSNDRLLSAVESTLVLFNDPLKAAARWPRGDPSFDLESLRLSQIGITSTTPLVKDALRNISNDLARECSELQLLEGDAQKNERKLEGAGRLRLEEETGLECERILQDVESQMLTELRQTIAEFRQSLKSDGFEDPDHSERAHVSRKARAAVARLRQAVDRAAAEMWTSLGTVRRTIRDQCDELTPVRGAALFWHQKFCHALWVYLKSLPSIAPPRGSVAKPPPTDTREGGGSDLIRLMRERLRRIQERREADLQESASFLQSVLRDEKKRIRSEVRPQMR
jgi:hypothetical protein